MITNRVTCTEEMTGRVPQWFVFVVRRSWFAFMNSSTDKESTAAVQNHLQGSSLTSEGQVQNRHSIAEPTPAHSVSARQTAIYAAIPRSNLRLC